MLYKLLAPSEYIRAIISAMTTPFTDHSDSLNSTTTITSFHDHSTSLKGRKDIQKHGVKNEVKKQKTL